MTRERDMVERRDTREGGAGANPPIGEIQQAMRHAPSGRDKRGKNSGQGGKGTVPPIGEIAQAERDD
jgi:hypothetical protein